MDFLATVKKRLEELEEQARQMQALEQGTKAPSPKASSPSAGRAPAPARALSPTRSKTPERKDVRKSASARPTARSLASPDGFTTPKCATADLPSKRKGSESAGLPSKSLNRRLIDDLRGRLDEAFLLSEVLGKPRCVRGWDDD